MGTERERPIEPGDVVQVVGSMEVDGNKLVGTIIDTWLEEEHIESVWWNIMLSTGNIIQWPAGQLKVLSPNPTVKKGNE